ncbi:inositol phosphorylceramide synthase [Streptomyces armeniacus]|uniref:Inositol phosphorylceramide synthase n=1 Tax=Streptomyces armeniacus TaxID=83291 RepID=A0A345Y0K1_9ACTN|nr:inositol phosphorylceramide synthase [Streptomyces armeniacus]
MLWTLAGVAALGFLAALEFAAYHYGLPGPVATQAREVILTPRSGPLLYATLALMMVVLPWRERFIAAAVAVGIDIAYLPVRWAFDAKMYFGNGALWVLLGYAVIAFTHRTGRERALLLKGVGLGLLLLAGRKTGETWLLITSTTRPMVLDQYVAVADHALGSPSWLAGRIVEATGPIGTGIIDWVYVQLAIPAVVIAIYQLRNVASEGRFPGHHLVRTFLLIGLLGPGIYMIFPVVGPVYAYGAEGGQWALAHLWPNTPPAISPPHPIPHDEITPRNCMPSLHTAWTVVIFIHSRTGPRLIRYLGTFWLVATLGATLGFGYHYGVDIVAGVVFAVTIEAALRAHHRGWDRPAVLLVVYGTTAFAALLASYRYLPMEMARQPWVCGPLLLLVMISVVHLYVRTTRLWGSKSTPAPQPEPQPALV